MNDIHDVATGPIPCCFCGGLMVQMLSTDVPRFIDSKMCVETQYGCECGAKKNGPLLLVHVDPRVLAKDYAMSVEMRARPTGSVE